MAMGWALDGIVCSPPYKADNHPPPSMGGLGLCPTDAFLSLEWSAEWFFRNGQNYRLGLTKFRWRFFMTWVAFQDGLHPKTSGSEGILVCGGRDQTEGSA